MNGLMDTDQSLHHPGCRGQSKAKNPRPRRLHQSTLNLGDAAPCYTTTHSQSYSGRAPDGHPLTFQLRDPSFPSQHKTRPDLCNITITPRCPLQSHTQEVHGPKHITARIDPKEPWVWRHSGQAIREIIYPEDPSDNRTAHKSEQTLPVTYSSTQPASGKPTQWHQYNILTGEQTQAADPTKSFRRSRDVLLQAAKPWESDCCAFRLY